MAARFKIIVLDKPDADTFHVVFWADVPAARQPFYAKPGAVSAWKAALQADNDKLVSGEVTEQERRFSVAGMNVAQARAAAEALWTQFQDVVTTNNPWTRYGETWNGTTWVPGGVV